MHGAQTKFVLKAKEPLDLFLLFIIYLVVCVWCIKLVESLDFNKGNDASVLKTTKSIHFPHLLGNTATTGLQ